MSYLIENIIRFDEIKGSLINIETGDEINVPPSAVFIFIVLLNKNHAAVERREFIEQIYTRFGFDMSKNTLNQYVSLLRKHIRNLGIESDIIITIPRVGFYISSDIMVLKEMDGISVTNASGPQSTKKTCKYRLTLIIMVTLMIVEFSTILLNDEEVPKNYELVKAGRIGDCDLYLPINLKNVNFSSLEKNATTLAEKYLPCTTGSIFIYDIDAINFLKGSGKTYLGRCTGLPKEERYAVCTEVALSE